MLSILLNPILFTLAVRRIRADEPGETRDDPAGAAAALCNAGVVLIGYGRVGSHIGGMICGRGEGLTVIEDQKDMAAAAEAAGATVIVGDATKESILRQAGLDAASTLLIAITEGVEAGAVVRAARPIKPKPVRASRSEGGKT